MSVIMRGICVCCRRTSTIVEVKDGDAKCSFCLDKKPKGRISDVFWVLAFVVTPLIIVLRFILRDIL